MKRILALVILATAPLLMAAIWMDDQQTYKPYKAPVLSPPAGAVPVSGRELVSRDAEFQNPVTPTAAIPHDHSEPSVSRTIQVNGTTRPYFDQIAWPGVVGMVLLPATVAPVGRTPAGLPFGIQIVGPYLEDHTPIAFSRHLAEVIGGFEAPPGY